jgi:hypothetical protein
VDRVRITTRRSVLQSVAPLSKEVRRGFDVSEQIGRFVSRTIAEPRLTVKWAGFLIAVKR